jgi:hypothetical protein
VAVFGDSSSRFIQIEGCKRLPLLTVEWLKFSSSHAAKGFATQTEDPSIINNWSQLVRVEKAFPGGTSQGKSVDIASWQDSVPGRYAPFEADREMAAALDEQGRRRFAGLEARALGRGGVNLIGACLFTDMVIDRHALMFPDRL